MQVDKAKILVIEDESAAVDILAFRLDELKIPHEMIIFRTAEEALEYLDGRTAMEGLERPQLPDLIFLDIRLPGLNGFEVLKKIKTHSTLRTIPVIVISASNERADLIETYKRGGTFFLSKFSDDNVLGDVLRQLRIFNMFR